MLHVCECGYINGVWLKNLPFVKKNKYCYQLKRSHAPQLHASHFRMVNDRCTYTYMYGCIYRLVHNTSEIFKKKSLFKNRWLFFGQKWRKRQNNNFANVSLLPPWSNTIICTRSALKKSKIVLSGITNFLRLYQLNLYKFLTSIVYLIFLIALALFLVYWEGTW